jgi:hypothetical protein
MKKNTLYICCILALGILAAQIANAQPTTNQPNLNITQIMTVKYNAVRVAFDTKTNALYYITFFGDVYKIIQPTNAPAYDTLIATTADHNINYMQGLAIKDSIMYVVGNHKISGNAGYGIVAKGKLTASGARVWTNLLTTEPYPSTATLYDHAFSSIALSDHNNDVYIASGSRTDHGEIQTSGGLFPNQREQPLTNKIFKFSTNASNLMLYNRRSYLDSMGYIFAEGTRNMFDMAFDTQNNLFGVNNNGDRDDPETMHWIRQGDHFGFPWEMGGNQTPQQFAGYIPNNDKLINHNSLGYGNGYFYDDPTYPQRPPNLVVAPPIKNFGPDADKFRDTNGMINDASDLGISLTTFTSHRSPLGLIFDKYGDLGGNYNKNGFVLSYTIGTTDSSGTITTPSIGIGPFVDLSQDLLQLKMQYDSTTNNFRLNSYIIVQNFSTPVDAELVDNFLYVIETNSVGEPKLWKIEFPSSVSTNDPKTSPIKIYPNPVTQGFLVMEIQENHRHTPITICDMQGRTVWQSSANNHQNKITINTTQWVKGVYVLKNAGNCTKIVVQ